MLPLLMCPKGVSGTNGRRLQPDVLIGDEITLALDVSRQGAVVNVVRDLQRQLRLSMPLISHNLAVVHRGHRHAAACHFAPATSQENP